MSGNSTILRATLAAAVLGLPIAVNAQAPPCHRQIPRPVYGASDADHLRYQTEMAECLSRQQRQPGEPRFEPDTSIYRQLQPVPPIDVLGSAHRAAQLGAMQQRRALDAEAAYAAYADTKTLQLRALLTAAPDLRPALDQAAARFATARKAKDWQPRVDTLRALRVPDAAITFFDNSAAGARFAQEFSWRVVLAAGGPPLSPEPR